MTAAELFETYEMRQVLEITRFPDPVRHKTDIPVPLSAHLDLMEEPYRLARCRAGDRDAIAEHAKRTSCSTIHL